jgi:hypothetical protein
MVCAGAFLVAKLALINLRSYFLKYPVLHEPFQNEAEFTCQRYFAEIFQNFWAGVFWSRHHPFMLPEFGILVFLKT